MRGFLGGASIGALVAAAGAAMLSLSVPLNKAVDVADVTPAGTEEPASGANVPVESPMPDADLVEAVPQAPAEQSGDDLSALADADTSPGEKPQAKTGASVLGDPENTSSTPEISLQSDEPVQPVAALPVPTTPSQETQVVISTDPAQPPQPHDDVATTPLGAPTETPTPVVVTEPDVAVATPDVVVTAPDTMVTAPDVVVDVPGISPPTASEAPATTLPTVVDAPAPQEVPGEAAGERIAALPTTTTGTANDGPAIGTPVVPFTERDKGNVTEVAASATTETPFQSYSQPFENPDDRPLMSIVLIDDSESIGAEALVGFPYPLTFAIDPMDPDAAEKMAARRAAGFEVMVLADLAREAAPQDAETVLQVWFDTLPEVIGVLEGPDTGFQGNRPLADQVAAAVAASGRGFITQNNGLNTVQKLAARDGVPSAVVFRDFDGAGQNPKTMRRFLDQAAFRAGQEGAVVMLGRVRPDTISALLLWGLQDRASRVALAPASASLRLKGQ